MSARYAVYFAPAPGGPLADKAAAWLGRDAYQNAPRERPPFPALADLDLDALTADPRSYGFHATLKAPFELAPGRSEGELLAFAETFARAQEAFDAAIAPQALGRFLAFRLTGSNTRMQGLHAACVRDFEPLRAPLSEFDLARRRKSPLTAVQDERLVAWGYPYVFDDFRFHMTLTNSIGDEGVRERVLAALVAHFAPETGGHRFDGVAVFRQASREAPFVVAARFPFQAAVPALSA
jgi:hypothetical protein